MISVIIPHYDDVSLLAANLPKSLRLLRQSRLQFEVVVVDDCSPESVQGELRKLEKEIGGEVKFLFQQKNLGFGATVNRGMEEVGGEIVFVLKADVAPEGKNYFKLMTDHFRDPMVFAVSSALISEEEGREEVRGQGVVVYFRGLFQHFRTRGDFDKWLLTNRTTRRLAGRGEAVNNGETALISAWADGGSSAYRRELFLQLGGFEKLLLPFYWEDTDLGYRAWKAGYKVLFEPEAKLTHDYRRGTIAKHYSKEYLLELNIRNQFLFVGLNADTRHLVESLVWSVYHLIVAAKNGNWAFWRGFLRAKIKAIPVFLARIERRRRSRLTDDAVLNIFKKI